MMKKKEKVKKDSYISQVRAEMKQVIWPSFKTVLKYFVATVFLCLLFVVFFMLINLLSSFVKGLFI
jgi:preprotein translocase SecE subunit